MTDHFEFSIHVQVMASRHVAKRVAEAMAEVLEDATILLPYGEPSRLFKALERAQGLTVEVTGVTRLRYGEM